MEVLNGLVVLVEGLIACSATYLLRKWWRQGLVRPFVGGVVLGMAWCPFLHGIAFGLLHADGPGGARDEPGMLAGFGVVSAVLPGFPLGVLLGLAMMLLSRTRSRSPTGPAQDG